MAVKKNRWLVVYFGLFTLAALLGGLVWFIFFQKNNPKELEKELTRKERELKRYQSEQKISPTPEAHALLQKINEKLTKDLKLLEEMIQKSRFEIPEGTVTDGLFFREQLFKIDKDLHSLASGKEVILPATLGFPEELPDVKRVPLLLRQLLTAQEVAGSFIEIGGVVITLMKPLEPTEYKNNDAGQVIFVELPVQIGVECSFQTLVETLIRVRNSPQVIVIRELQVKAKDDETLQVQLIVSGFLPSLGSK